MPQLNENILSFDSKQTVNELLTALRTITPEYVVLRRSYPEQEVVEFYVFPTPFLRNSILSEIGFLKRRASLVSVMPQLISDHQAPQLNSDHRLHLWNDVYEEGPWQCALYPVATSYEYAIGVWEPDANDQYYSLPEPAVEYSDIDSDVQLSGPEQTVDELFELDHVNAPRPTAESVDVSPLEERFPQESLTESELEIAADEVDSLLQNHTLFPNIEASNLHPFVEESVHITVSLQAEQVSEITGSVNLPDVGDEDYVYGLKVHLLCGEESYWDTLQYAQGKGMLKNAEFQLTMPDMPLDLAGNYPDRHKLPLRVNFYFKSRWCGEGERYLDLRLDEHVEPLSRIPPPPQSEWRKLIKLEPISEAPDLLVRIAHRPGTTAYHWTCLSPHLEFDTADNSVMTLTSSAQQFVNDLFEPFATVELDELKRATLKGVCEEIYDSTPECFKQAYWLLSEAANTAPFEFKSILFISDESYVPWELMRITDPELEEEAGILSTSHSVGRWLAGSSNHLSQQITVNRFAVSGSDYIDQKHIPNLPHVDTELAHLSQRYQAEDIPLTSHDVLSFLQNGSAQAMHFACHGMMSVKTPYKSQLLMEDHPQSITPPAVSSYEVETGLGAEHPLIFLNACQAGATADQLSLVSGFPAAFLKAGASAVICPLWTVDDEQASIISKLFYGAAFEQPGITLGEIMQKIHQRWESEQHLTYLAYVLYGDPQTRVTFVPEIQTETPDSLAVDIEFE
ncbi:CHAT domain-containing protein [Leucothrix pacifica]|uniref:CHAT domain-containing protein n=1 Tax=Leucothrix pacifica TaxID=1247513 RepID=A0A317CR07_9GAMM|nr:CHAT domain-containing protein [Leucothrix pacifica]PWR00710.1 hypothetical protein DKW60_00430 [Leucothrix pacifica]